MKPQLSDISTAHILLIISTTLLSILIIPILVRRFLPGSFSRPVPQITSPRTSFSSSRPSPMAPPSKVSPVTGNPVPPHYLHASSVNFQDTQGRSVLLRGVNLSGSAKNPLSCPSQSQDGFWEEAEEGTCDFVNSSLNLDDGSADVSTLCVSGITD